MCQVCLLLRRLYARGCCRGCWKDLAGRDGALDEHAPRVQRSTQDMLDDWDVLRRRGMKGREAGVYMGYAPNTLERLLYRVAERKRNEQVGTGGGRGAVDGQPREREL